jgi:predicted Rossmann-fold nucleotide-binding protein
VEELLKEGIGVYVARALHTEQTAYEAPVAPHMHVHGEEDLSTAGASMKQHALFFDSGRYETFCKREKAGAKFYLVLPDMADEMDHGNVIPAHVREFDRGLWVKPESLENVRKVNTIIAMYGSHVHGMDSILQPQLDAFMVEMKEVFGASLGVTHGKGPGVMKMADDAAARAGVVRIGVGICVEGQAGNCRPEAMVDFFDTDRLRRQKLMDDLATFKIFNIGGAGTLEEAAITLCSQKLGKKAITPIIFVDPLGAGRNGEHLFKDLYEQIETLSDRKDIVIDPDTCEKIRIQLLAPETPKYIHCVSSYEEAAAIIRAFKENPARYYAERGIPAKTVTEALTRQEGTLAQTGFPEPDFLREYSTGAAA